MTSSSIKIIGGGLAGCEAAFYLLSHDGAVSPAPAAPVADDDKDDVPAKDEEKA